ncbi:MAG: phosphoglucosamine mutase [Fibrobacteria bacterium]|nr:phosphoglucosamine mutase [Fibrobacteria bacterium]
MSRLMRSISGIRGIVGESLTPPILLNYLNAFLQVTKASKVVIGRDTRVSGPMVESLIIQGCIASGVEPIILGISSTPTVEMMVTELKADGGIIITASHNPVEWNALKFLNNQGVFLKEAKIQELFALVDEEKFKWVDYKKASSIKEVKAKSGDSFHVEKILDLDCINTNLIRGKKYKVAYDAVNGAGSLIVPMLLKKLGCEIVEINTEPTGIFAHNAEPVPESLGQLSKTVKDHNCDIGFATDPDADRLAIVSDKGEAIGEEYTLVLATQLILNKEKGPITVNLSTSRMNEDIAKKYGVRCYRAKVGEINVSEAMMENKSIIGGEGNGGVILPKLHYGRDGILAVAMILQLMAEEDKSLSELVKEIPAYTIEKQKVSIEDKPINKVFGRLMAKFQDIPVNEQDGIRFDWGDRWVHIRASNTEPVIRIIAEAPSAVEAKDLCAQIAEEI